MLDGNSITLFCSVSCVTFLVLWKWFGQLYEIWDFAQDRVRFIILLISSLIFLYHVLSRSPAQVVNK